MYENSKICHLLDCQRIVLALVPGAKEAILRQLLSPLVEQKLVGDPDEIVQTLMRREQLMTTAVKQGLALPHAFTSQVTKPHCVVGICPEGAGYDSIDGSPTYCFFMLIEPPGSYEVHLRLLSRLSQLVARPGLVQALLSAQDPGQVLKVICAREEDASEVGPSGKR